MTVEASRIANGTPGTSRTQFEYHRSTPQSLSCVQTNNILQQKSVNLQIQLTPQINQNVTTVWAQTHTHTHTQHVCHICRADRQNICTICFVRNSAAGPSRKTAEHDDIYCGYEASPVVFHVTAPWLVLTQTQNIYFHCHTYITMCHDRTVSPPYTAFL